jgi:hypothetical protein
MKRSFHVYSKAVWPSPGWVLLFVLPYVLLALGLRILNYNFPGVPMSDLPEIGSARTWAISAAAVWYAMYRLVRFHPICSFRYESWLKTTPWLADKPLPLGPVLPVWQDAVVLGVLAAFAKWQAHVDPVMPVLAFGVTYLIGMNVLLALTRTWSSCWALGFLWPVFLIPGASQWLKIGMGAALLAVVWHGHRKSLRTFPWRKENPSSHRPSIISYGDSFFQSGIRLERPQNVRTPTSVGWPYSCLSPKYIPASVSRLNSLLGSLLAGWWTYCIIRASDAPPIADLILFFTIIGAFVRFAGYCSGLVPAVNIGGRIGLGRLILPGFDRVFLTPLASIGLAILGGMWIHHAGQHYAPVCAAVVSVVCFALLSGGPSVRKWVLTGDHRSCRSILQQTRQQPLTQV